VSAALVGELRSGRPPIALAQEGAGSITLRVQVAEMWDAVRVVARPEAIVAEVKQKVVAEFFPGHQYADDFVLKLRGWEMLDEAQSLSKAGVIDGAIVLLAYRRRRPVR
jgi:hypothetical protein